MHDPYYSSAYGLTQVNHLSGINDMSNTQMKLSNVITNKIQNHEYFYGIEISARSMSSAPSAALDYNIFKIQPLFTSIIWLGEIYADLLPIKNIPAVRCANTVAQGNIVMPHITCYKMTDDKLQEILANNENIKNFLVLRGDAVDSNQNYKHALDLVKKIRELKGDNISIGVGGYPEGHPNSVSLEEDMKYLKMKVDAGADFIITQLCFSEVNLKNFIQNCYKNGINVPIIPGIYIPESFRSLQKMSEITKIQIPQELFKKFEQLKENRDEFLKFSQENAINMINNLYQDKHLNIYGIQFFTLNHFRTVSKIINKIF